MSKHIPDPAGFIYRALAGESVDYADALACVERCNEELHDARNEAALAALVRHLGVLVMDDREPVFEPNEHAERSAALRQVAAGRLVKSLGLKYIDEAKSLIARGDDNGWLAKLIAEQEERWKR